MVPHIFFLLEFFVCKHAVLFSGYPVFLIDLGRSRPQAGSQKGIYAFTLHLRVPQCAVCLHIKYICSIYIRVYYIVYRKNIDMYMHVYIYIYMLFIFGKIEFELKRWSLNWICDTSRFSQWPKVLFRNSEMIFWGTSHMY